MPQRVKTFRHAANSLLRAILLGLVLFGPTIVGVPRLGHKLFAGVMGATVILLVVLWILSGSSSERSHNIVFVVVSCFLTLTLVDVVARPLVGTSLNPAKIIEWPPMPLVTRYLPNVRFKGTIYGELAQIPGMRGYREYRDVRFTTDRFGFRNEGPTSEPLDLIALGDSYTMGHNTTQDSMWSTILSKQYGLHVYNMAVGGDGPWHEFTNLTLEVDRLKLKPQETVVLWDLFTGNDLWDACYPIFRRDELPWRKGLARLFSAFSVFRDRSPLGTLLFRTMKRTGLSFQDTDLVVKNFVDGTGIIFSNGYAREGDRSLDNVRHAPNYDCLRQTIAAMRHFAETKNLTVAIMVSPSKEEVYSWVLHGAHPWSTSSDPSGFAAAVREIARENHLPFLDLKPLLIEASQRVYRQSGHLLWWRDDTHWNADGHMEVARIVYKLYASLKSGMAGDVHVRTEDSKGDRCGAAACAPRMIGPFAGSPERGRR
jgi:hypothetical protein